MDEQKQQVKEAATAVAKEEGTKAIEKAVKGTEAEKIVGTILGKSDTSKTKSDTTQTQQQKQVEDAKSLIKGLLKKKKN
jgi:hypothetical protein